MGCMTLKELVTYFKLLDVVYAQLLHSLASLMLISWSAIEFYDSTSIIYDTES
jgi:hypothetical protein